ncbi:HPF/RaiA family ribosome-associated protein [Thiorhodococcus fuscus]|uniref:HPF/RaiA family ribosome-associated protein n=1 Tax=Thiorhodococcus fuscus TaxID=527200 RepID=A0ABW4Y6K9_9GAMM
MPIKIGGDTLALDADIRRQIESEAKKFADRFPDERVDAHVTIKEEFDPLHGHRVRCELSAKLCSGRQVLVRDARKNAAEAIEEVFVSARRSVRRLRRQHSVALSSVPSKVTQLAQAGH